MNQKIANPHSLLVMLEFRRFIDVLPHGTVTFEMLTALVEKIMEADPKAAFILLNYGTDQELYLQKYYETN